jgi:hypothetical protein
VRRAQAPAAALSCIELTIHESMFFGYHGAHAGMRNPGVQTSENLVGRHYCKLRVQVSFASW